MLPAFKRAFSIDLLENHFTCTLRHSYSTTLSPGAKNSCLLRVFRLLPTPTPISSTSTIGPDKTPWLAIVATGTSTQPSRLVDRLTDFDIVASLTVVMETTIYICKS